MKFLIISLLFVLNNGVLIAQKKQSAQSLITTAIAKAKKENKKVFIKYTASWCGWCHQMQNAMTDSTTKKIFSQHYIVLPIDVLETPQKKELETPGGDSTMAAHGGAESGLPYWVILNDTGNVIANSNEKKDDQPLTGKGENVGCPAQKNEIDYFLKVLKATSTLNEKELQIIKKRFEKINSKL